MADTPPKRKRGRPKKVPELPIEKLAEGAAAAALDDAPPAPETPPIGDVPPGGGGAEGQPRARRRSRVTKKGTQAIEDGLAEILQMPAVPAGILGDQWAAEHFTVQGRAFANKIAVVSERNMVLRGWCERALEGESIAVLFMAGIMYAGPAAMHFGLLPGGEMIGVPVLRKRPKAAPTATAATEPEEATMGREAPEAKQYGGEPVEAPIEVLGADDDAEAPPVWMGQMAG